MVLEYYKKISQRRGIIAKDSVAPRRSCFMLKRCQNTDDNVLVAVVICHLSSVAWRHARIFIFTRRPSMPGGLRVAETFPLP
jgi:hypothetical protein